MKSDGFNKKKSSDSSNNSKSNSNTNHNHTNNGTSSKSDKGYNDVNKNTKKGLYSVKTGDEIPIHYITILITSLIALVVLIMIKKTFLQEDLSDQD